MSRKGRVYTPKETVLAEKSYIIAAGEDPPVFDGPVSVEMTFCKEATRITIRSLESWETPLRGDLDNYVKLCLDGCQRAGIIPNDRLVMRLEASKE
jgi:Holliday junction resolvase RusA-like endonuclease|tara:strand:+ start:1371 stop:1658 length:288 start_codon:yes stop_codon:yes gene_type:complete